MERKMTFDGVVENYDRYRPSYPSEMLKDITDFSKNSLNNILEIGAGTGQATRLFLNTKANITAVDIGENMARFLLKKFGDFPNIKCVCSSFEEYESGGTEFDLIYSATAFHWLDEKTALPKIKNMLKDNGVIALFWNHPFVGRVENAVHSEIRKVYAKYRPDDKPPKEFSESDTEKYVRLLNEFGFKDVTVKLYYRERRFTAEEYVCLLNTYSDHRLLSTDIKAEFESEIYNAIKNNGNEITVYDTIDLYLARK